MVSSLKFINSPSIVESKLNIMKKIFTLFVFALMTTFVMAQTFVSTAVENRNVVIEEFTGIHCVYCPDGHKLANEYAEANPGDVLLINIHTGGYANPNAGEPDFRTAWGDAIAGQSDLAGYPAGTVNRHLFAGMQQANGTAMSRGDWDDAGDIVLAETSYVNADATAEIDIATGTMTIVVEVYFTDNSASASNFVNVAILQNNVEGPQTGGANFYPEMMLPNGNYMHHHMLRDLVTGQWGEEITTVASGDFWTATYTYAIPTDINGVPVNMGNLEVGVFVTETTQEIESGKLVHPTFVNFPTQNDARVFGLKAPADICDPTIEPIVKIQNLGGTDLTSLDIEYSVNGETPMTMAWTGTLTPFQEAEVLLPAVTFTMMATNTLTVTTTSTNGVADEDATNNDATTDIMAAPGSWSKVYFELAQDRYGSEIEWAFVDANGTVLESGGPYTDLSANGIAVVEELDIWLPALGCYEFKITDAYGDGIDAGYGAGYYTITDSEGTVVASGGQYTAEDVKPFEVTDMTVNSIVSEVFEGGFVIAPNPTSNVANVALTVETAQTVNFSIYNNQGQIVKVIVENVVAGTTQTEINVADLATGIYMMSVRTEAGVATERLIIQ